MKETPLDSKRQNLVAALYGELSAEETARFRAMLEEDPSLRAEWEELQSARELLESARGDDVPPGFVFLEPPAAARRAGGMFGRFRPGWAFGFGAAAVVLLGLVAAGFRVDRLDRGVAFRFGPETPPTAFRDDTVTRQDLDMYSAAMMRAMADAIGETRLRNQREFAYVLERFYDDLVDEQSRKYDDLRARVDGVGLGLMAEQTRTNARLSRLIDAGRPEVVPAGQRESTPPREPEQEQKP